MPQPAGKVPAALAFSPRLVHIGPMRDSDIEAIASWLVGRGLAGAPETELLHGLCERCCGVGLPLTRGLALIDTLHPIHEGRAFRWRNDGVEENAVVEYGRTDAGEAAENWRKSAFYHLLTTGADELHCRIAEEEPGFAQFDELKAEGQSDYLALIHRFASEGSMGEMDCFYSRWTTDRPEGFATPISQRCGGWRRRWRSPSNAPRWRA